MLTLDEGNITLYRRKEKLKTLLTKVVHTVEK